MWIAIVGIVLGVVLVVGFVVLMFGVVPKLVLKKVQAKLELRVAETVPADQIVRKDLTVVSFGLESRGVTQGRGNGALVLTPTELRWLQLTPQRSDVTIPLGSITTVDTTGSHLGKTYGKPLLHVTFTEAGASDSMAWYTTDASGWVATLRGVAGDDEHPLAAGS